MTTSETDGPRNQSREYALDHTILALLRTGTRRCRLLAALIAVALISQFASAAYARSGQTVLYLDAPSVSEERAARAGDVASAYSAVSGSPVAGETLAWLALPGGEQRPMEPPEEALGAFASLTAPSAGAGVDAEEALAAGETMLAQLEESEERRVSEEDEELASGAIRPRLGTGSTPPGVEPAYEGGAAMPDPNPETTGPGSQDYGSPPLVSTPDAPREDGGVPVGDFEEEPPEGAGLVVAESGAELEMPNEVEFASAPSETIWFVPDASGDADQSEDYGSAGPVSDTGPPPTEETGEEPRAAPDEEATEEFVAEEPTEARPEAQTTPMSASELGSEPTEEPPEEFGSVPTTSQPPPTSADTGTIGAEGAEFVLAPTSGPDAVPEHSTPEESEPTASAPAAEPARPPEGTPTLEGPLPTAPTVEYASGGSETVAEPARPTEASPIQTSASPGDSPSGSQQFEIVVGGSDLDASPENPAPHEGTAPTLEPSSSPAPAPDDGEGSSERGEPESLSPEMPSGESLAPHEASASSERPPPEKAVAEGAPIPAGQTGGVGSANEGTSPGVPEPTGEPETATAPPPARGGQANPSKPTVAERRAATRTMVEERRAIEQVARRQEIAAEDRAARQAERQAVAVERRASERAAAERANVIAQQRAVEEQREVVRAAIEQRVIEQRATFVEQQAAAIEQASIEEQAIGQVAAEETDTVADQQRAAERAVVEQTTVGQDVVPAQQVVQRDVERQRPAYTAYQQPQPIEQTPAQQSAATSEVAHSEVSLPMPQPRIAEATEPVERVAQPAWIERTPQNESTSAPGAATEPVVVSESTTNTEVGR